jgi:hypothetical protein
MAGVSCIFTLMNNSGDHRAAKANLAIILKKVTVVATQNEQGGQTFSLIFVENIRKNLIRRGIARRRLANKRPAAIQALMTINKSNVEIQRDLQSAFTRIAHERK